MTKTGQTPKTGSSCRDVAVTCTTLRMLHTPLWKHCKAEIYQSFFGTVQIPWSSTSSVSSSSPPSHADLFTMRAILLEYIPGHTIRQVAQKVPQHAWQDVCNQAICIVDSCSDFGVLNKDVRLDNFIVTRTSPARRGTEPEKKKQQQQDTETNPEIYKVYMIDFAQCRLRRPGKTDHDWGRAKWIQDEEGAIGTVLRHRLQQDTGVQLEYEPSLRLLQWAPAEDDD